MKIAVIGGNRFTGKKLVESLLEKNDVTIFNRSESGPDGAKIFKFDRDEDKILLDDFDCIVDMCLYSKKQFKKIKKFIPKDKKYIFISSAAAGIKEFGRYSSYKKEVEDALSKTNLNYTIVRPSYIDGPGNHLKRIEYYINFLKNEYEIEIDGETGDNPINIIYVNDVVKVLLKIINLESKHTKGKTFIVAGDKSITIDELIETIKKELNIEEHKIKNSLAAPFPNIPLEVDNKLTKKFLKVKFCSPKLIIKKIIEELKNENEIQKS